MSQRFLVAGGVLLVVLGIVAPIVLAVRDYQQRRRFRVVRNGVLYRSAQLPTTGIQRLAYDHGIRTVVNLRDGTTALDKQEEAYCRAHGIRFVRIAPLAYDDVPGKAEIDRGLNRFLAIMRDPANHPVLVHCWRGIHRTGVYVAMYRMECEGWSKEEALREMVDLGYDLLPVHHDVRTYLERYQPRYSAKLSVHTP